VTRRFAKSPSRAPAQVDLCVVGNLTIDVIFRGIREMPPWGQEVLAETRTESVAGQAAAMGFASVALGMTVEVVGAVGDDAAGERIRRELGDAGVGVEALSIVEGGVTPLSVALVRPDGERSFISDLGRLGNVNVESLTQQWPRALSASVLALVGTSNLPGLDLRDAADMLGRARAEGALSVFDPGWDAHGWSPSTVEAIRTVLAETDLFLPNLDEARALTGESDVESVVRAISQYCAGVVIVKAGGEGSYVAIDDEILVVHALATKVDNAVGAGDVFDAGVIAGFLRGGDVVSAMALGTAAASRYVSRHVDRFASYDECDTLARQVTTTSI